ncbi:hypothetical protein AB0C95_16120 [Streptomyces caniferus]|uniref:hypothetical protein n=1 Tax=Streptomyces caniferus TaxID=285557 RepID=UPI0033C343CF
MCAVALPELVTAALDHGQQQTVRPEPRATITRTVSCPCAALRTASATSPYDADWSSWSV